ncbi:MAG: hypothetical protein NC078_12425, partial [Ruminococcus sp.]|nr:hypothetical protein [Ruminococcus sp.]
KVCGRIFEITPGMVEEFGGGFEGYLEKKKSRAQAAETEKAAQKSEREQAVREEKKENAYRSKEQRAAAAQRRQRIKELERLIEELEKKMEVVAEEMISPEVTADFKVMNEKCAEYEELKRQSGELTDEWVELCEEE